MHNEKTFRKRNKAKDVFIIMNTQIECVPCFINQAIRVLRANKANEDFIKTHIQDILEVVKKVDFSVTPIENAYFIYDFLKRILNKEDVYEDIKREHNMTLLSKYDEFKEYVYSQKDPLFTALRLSVGANIVDLGSKDAAENVFDEVLKASERTFWINQFDILTSDLKRAQNVVFFLDNAGEAVLDKLFIEVILDRFPQIKEVTVVAKAEPFINDITVKEALEIGFEEIDKIKLVGIHPTRERRPNYWSTEILELIQNSDVTITKGQANYEALEVLGIYHIFFVKCAAISKYVGAPVGYPVLFKRF